MSVKDITREKKLKILEQLLNSSEFQGNKYGKLLDYLIHAEINGEEIKESTIAIDCFDKDSSFNPATDSSVRVYLSNLRKKLEHYYFTDGKDETIRVCIPKGHYQIEFVGNDQPDGIQSKSFYKNAFYVTAAVLIVTVIGVILLNVFSEKIPPGVIAKDDLIWKDYLTSKTKTLIVLGDYYFFSMPYAEGRQSYIRDIEINSRVDLQEFLNANPAYKDKVFPTYHTWLEESHPWCVAQLLPSFLYSDTKFEIKLSSEIQLNDLQKYNIIYIGPYKCLYTLKNITDNMHFKYSLRLGPSTLEFKDIKTDSVHTYTYKANPQTNARNDYATVLKVAGPNNNEFMFFLSEHDFGNISTVKYFTELSKISEFEKDITSDHFEALFEVTGIIRTDFTIKLLHRNELKSDFAIRF